MGNPNGMTTAPPRPPRTFADRVSGMRFRTVALVAGLAAVLLGLVASLAFLWPADPAPAPPGASVDTQVVPPEAAKAPGAVVPPDGPDPDQPPFGIDARSLLDEVRSHAVPLADTDAQRLVDIGNRAVARNQPDLPADDPEIRRDLRAAFPGWSAENYSDSTRCVAEYAERVIARNAGTVPPDSDDHQGS